MINLQKFSTYFLLLGFLIFGNNLFAEGYNFQKVSLKKAKKLAKKQNKMVFILVSTPYCQDCTNISNLLAENGLSKLYDDKYISITLNPDKISNNVKLNSWGITKIPAVIYIDPGKDIVYKSIGIQTKDSLYSHTNKAIIKK